MFGRQCAACSRTSVRRHLLRVSALMFVTMVDAVLIVEVAFGGLGLIPSEPRPTRDDITGTITLDYKFVLNILGLAIFAVLF